MKILSLNEIQDEELKILKSFINFCGEKGLSYSLGGGTLLGAIRHKGFIPWDDDIDISLSRPDYDSFLDCKKEFEDRTGFKIVGHISNDLHWAPFIKIVNPEIIVTQVGNIEESNLWIDVFPVDGLPRNYLLQRILITIVGMLRLLLSIYTTKYNVSRNPLKNIIRALFKVFRYVPGFKHLLCVIITKLSTLWKYGDTESVAAISWGVYGTSEILPFAGYDTKLDATFQGTKCLMMQCWDLYLKRLYGDYMQIPPEDKRINHRMTACRL